MSLFPAYISENQAKSENNEPTTSSVHCKDGLWLQNKSCTVSQQSLTSIQLHASRTDQALSDDSSLDCSTGDGNEDIAQSVSPVGHLSKGTQNKEFESKRKRRKKEDTPMEPVLDFTGQEEFYVDKKRASQYNTIETLHKPARPRYHVYHKTLGRASYLAMANKQKRYYKQRHEDALKNQGLKSVVYALSETEYVKMMGELNRKTLEDCKNINHWVDIIALQDRNPYKWSGLTVAEKKLVYLQKALEYNAGQEDLYRLYIDIVTQTYTSHDVSKMLDALLHKDPNCLILWQALIMCTQGTMARCTVPEVLRIYEKCMKKMFHNHKQASSNQASDEVMLKLFYNCCLFLRQAGLYEQFIALIKLAIELNIPSSAKLLEDMQPSAQTEQTLIEYEEIVLQSGLPMTELWLRTEKLRQSFNFLPYPSNKLNCSDPQRIVFNEDICHYVYPLKSHDNSFKMLISILKLLKFPFIASHTLGNQLQGDTDALEDMLAVFIKPDYLCSWDHQEFFASLFDLSKSMVSTPTFLCNTIAHELYSQTLKKLVMNCAQAYEHKDERKQLIFLQLWCRFERFLLKQEKLHGKLTTEYLKEARKRFKSLLKQQQNHAFLQLYVELALYELEADAAADSIENIFKNLLEAYDKDQSLQSDLALVYLTYAEVCIKWQKYDKAAEILTVYGLGLEPSQLSNITNAKKLSALNKMKEKLNNSVKIEQNVEIMLLEQHFMNDYTLSQINMYCLLCYTLQKKQEALEYLQQLFKVFKTKTNPRHEFLKEHIYEIKIKILQLPEANSGISHKLIQQTIYNALSDYPNNLYFLQKWGCQQALPWYKIRAGYINLNPSIKSVVFLIALARCRFINNINFSSSLRAAQTLYPFASNDVQYHESLVRQRILNLFKVLIPIKPNQSSSSALCLYSSLQRNSLFWRCYLSCLSDQNCSFELSEKCLLTALDECPWSKALYLDGATYVPQQLTHLQDLIIEKHLRIYALPEELEILRQR